MTRQTCERQCCRACWRPIQRVGTISKSVHIWLYYEPKTGRKSVNNACLGIKPPFFDIQKCGGAIKTGGWVGFHDIQVDWSCLKWDGSQIWVDAIFIWPYNSDDNNHHNNNKNDDKSSIRANQDEQQKPKKMINDNNNNNKNKNGDWSVATAGPLRRRTLLKGATETWLTLLMRFSINHTDQCFCGFLLISDSTAQQKLC